MNGNRGDDGARNLEITIFSWGGIKTGMIDGLKNWLTEMIIGYFILVPSCPQLTCSFTLFSAANEAISFPPNSSPFPRRFFQRVVQSSLRYDDAKAGRLLTKSPSS